MLSDVVIHIDQLDGNVQRLQRHSAGQRRRSVNNVVQFHLEHYKNQFLYWKLFESLKSSAEQTISKIDRQIFRKELPLIVG